MQQRKIKKQGLKTKARFKNKKARFKTETYQERKHIKNENIRNKEIL